jgi:tRNA A-37 threonylcarbamoyl transferase component Bud32
MKATYLGQLSRIEEELDLTIEARNVVKGEIYDGDEGISSMKLDSTVGASVNSMVLEKAPGTTLDRYVKDLRDKNATRFAELEEQKERMKDAEAVAKVREELVADLAQLIKRQKFMATLSDKWVTEGIFGKGFYHGDLHAGNIMINDDGVTLIDFGNATSLSEDQQLNVTRMVGAAAAGHVAGFMEGLKSLIKPEFKEIFDENGKNLSAELKKIFSLGDPNSAGQRIAVALLKVQEAGVEVPSAIFNFSQCQLRLQNAVEDMNTLIEEMKHQLIDMERLTKREAGHTTANPLEDGFCHIAAVNGTKETTADNGILMEDLALSARYVPCAFERVDLNRKTLMSGEFYKTVFKGRDDRKKMEAAVKKLCKRLLEAKERFSETDFKAIIKENSAISGITNLDYLLVDTRFSGAGKEKRIKELETHLMGKMDRWFQTIEVYKSKEKAIKKGDEDAMREFLESYSIFGMLKIEEGFVAAHYDLSSCVFRTFRNYLNAGFTLGLDEDIATYERLDEELGPQMRKQYDEYMEYIKDAGATVDGIYTRQEEIMLILSRLTEKRLRPFYENMETVYWDSVHSKPQSFVDVMGMTISRNYEKAMSRLGFFTGIYYNSKIR